MIYIQIIKYLSILTIITDWLSEIYFNDFFLNVSRGIRIFLLLYFFLNFIRHFNIIQHYFLTYYFIISGSVFLLYVQTDPNVNEGFWLFSKISYWYFGTMYFYYLLIKNKINYLFIFEWIKILIIIAVSFTIYFLSIGRLEEEYNANAYLMVFIFPLFVLDIKNISNNKILLFLLILSVVITLKRGALICISVSIIIAIIHYLLFYKINFIKRMVYFFTIIIFAFVLYSYMVSNYAERIEERFSEEQLDIESDKAGSGRSGMYKRLFESWLESEGYTFYLGHGNQADSYLVPDRRTHAHSDFFGWIYNYGFVGLMLFILQYIFLIGFILFNYKYLRGYRYVCLIFISIVLIVNFISGFYRDTYAFYLFLTPVFLDVIVKQRKYEIAASKNKSINNI